MSPLATLAIFCLVVSCADTSRDPPQITRLISLLPGAEIESPLILWPVAHSVSDLGSVALGERWEESFESPRTGFSLEPGCAREPGRGGQALACREEGRARAIVPAQPGTGYRIRLEGRQERPWGYVVTVTEHARNTALRTFRFPDFSERWEPHEIWIFSAPGTRALEINIEPRHAKGSLWLDEVVVEPLDLTREQEIRLLKAWHPRFPQDSDLGMVKHGRLLPVGDPNDVTSALRDNYVIRDALLAPPPTDIHFHLQVPQAARLSLSYALTEHSSPEDIVRLRVLMGEEGRSPQVLFEEQLSLGSDGRGHRWHTREISLAPAAGRTVRLTLETRALAGSGRAYPLWGNPEIYTPRRAEEPPNIILIAVDTLRADHLSCYGHKPGISPAIDALAADGIRFEQAISSANWTAPSFFSLFTGRAAPDLSESLREASELTLTEQLQIGGYSTGAILYKPMLYDLGFERGFDSFFNAPRYSVRAEDNLARALIWLKQNRARRFFLFLHFNDPHQPFCQPEDTVDGVTLQRLEDFGLRLPIMVYARDATTIDFRYPTRALDRRRSCRDCRDAATLTPGFKTLARDLYDHAIRYVDHNIGEFLAALKEQGLYDEAVIAFVSDHGETLWSHGEHYGHGRDNLHDELIHVPLIVKPPKSLGRTAGEVSQQVRLLDLMPTLLELAGIDPPSSAAQSLLPAFEPHGATTLRDRPAFSISRRSNTLSLRHGGWKYIRYEPKSPDDPRRERLYDLSADPDESVNLAPTRLPVLERMRLAMDEQLLAHGTGRLVLVKGDSGSEYRIRLHWDRATAVGLFPQPGLKQMGSEEEASWEHTSIASRSLIFLASFMTSNDASVELEIQTRDQPERHISIGPEEMLPYRQGLLADLLSRPGVQVQVFAGKDPTLGKSDSQAPIDAQQLEALKALGYIQ